MEKFYRVLNRNHWLVIAVWAAVALLCLSFALTGFGLGRVWNRTVEQTGAIPGSESYQANQVLLSNRSSYYNVYLLVTGVDTAKQQKEILTVLQASAKNLQEIPGVIPAGVLHPFAAGTDTSNPAAAQLMQNFIARNRHGFLMIAMLDLRQFPERAKEIRQLAETTLASVPQDLRSFAPQAKGYVTDDFIENHDISVQADSDFQLASLIALAAIALIQILAWGRLRLAAVVFVPALVGMVFSRATVNLASLFVTPNPEDPALVTMLCLGIVTGYALTFLKQARTGVAIVRYTGEIPQISTRQAKQRRVRRNVAGSALDQVFAHTSIAIMWSSGLLILALATVCIFPANSLRWVAVVSILSILGCLGIGLTLVPAIIYAYLQWLELPPAPWNQKLRDVLATSWAGLAQKTQQLRQKLPLNRLQGAALAGIVLLGACLPVLGLTWHTSASHDLPSWAESAQFHTLRASQYGSTAQDADIQVLAKTTQGALTTWSSKVLALKGVASSTVDPNTYGDYLVLDVNLQPGATNREAMKVVSQIRELKAKFPIMVTGAAANQIDFGNKVLQIVPTLMVPIMFISSVLMMIRATGRRQGSLVAGVLNVFIVTGALGLTALTFQDGIFSWIPLFPHSGGVEPSVVVLLVGYGFALALDHQLHTLNRQRIPLATELPDDTHLSKISGNSSMLWLRTACLLVTFLAFLPVHLQAVKQSAFAMGIVLVLNSIFSRILLNPVLAAENARRGPSAEQLWGAEEPADTIETAESADPDNRADTAPTNPLSPGSRPAPPQPAPIREPNPPGLKPWWPRWSHKVNQ